MKARRGFIPLDVSDEMRPGLVAMARADELWERLAGEWARQEIKTMARELDELILRGTE